MARKVKAAVQPVTVNPEKIVRGLTTVFQGFSVMFDGMAEQMQLMQDMTDQLSFPGAAPAEDTRKDDEVETSEAESTEDMSLQTVDTSEATDTVQEEDTPPWEEPKQQDSTQPDASSKGKPAASITQADLTKVIVSKIKLKRDNNAKIMKYDINTIFMDGVAYNGTADGNVKVMGDDDYVAFGTVCKFDNSVSWHTLNNVDLDALKIDIIPENPNYLYVLKTDKIKFDTMHARSFYPSVKPYLALSEVASCQV